VKILPDKLSRYAAVAALLVKYGRTTVSPTTPVALGTTVTGPAEDADAPEQLARDLEALGPTFVKLGQVLSSRPDLLPRPYLDALERLQDNVKPFPFPDVQAIIEEDLGVRLSKAFATFEEKPLAAASLGQVHRATLREGTQVAVKVQRPDVAVQVGKDLEALEEVARFLEKHTETGKHYDVVGMVAEFREAIIAELDYVKEATNLRLIGKHLSEFNMIVVPQPIEGYVSTRVLTMEYVCGTKVTAISPVVRLELDGALLGETLIRAYLKQIVIDGVFHADPHPGNVFVTGEGRLALLDLGMIGRITPAMQEKLLKLLLAISEGRGEDAAEVSVVLGEKLPDFDEPAFKRAIATLVGRFGHETLADIQIGRVFIELNNVSREQHMRPPAELTMLGKTLLHLDEVARALKPDLDVNESIRRNSVDLMRRRVRKAVTSGSVFGAVLEAKEFAEKLPGRVNRVLDSLAASELKMKVELIDEGAIIGGLQKVANRITLGLILASLIVGAAMMMRIETTFRIMGYPGLAMLLFILAATGAGYLAVQILLHDRAPKRR
jgi:predicted unusual protein kinase regulating ubiquinone biosynthesis (AarF/ABC1/UbiB family)